MVAEAGLEPTLLYRKSILSRQRLPVPPLGRVDYPKNRSISASAFSTESDA